MATEAAALFRRCQLFKPTQSLPTSLLLILFFLSLSFQHFSPHILAFSLNTSSPLRVPCHPSPPLLWRLFHSGVARKKPAEHVINSGLYFCAPNEMAIVLPGGFYVIIFFSFSSIPPKCFILSAGFFSGERTASLARCDGAAVDSGPKQNGG